MSKPNGLVVKLMEAQDAIDDVIGELRAWSLELDEQVMLPADDVRLIIEALLFDEEQRLPRDLRELVDEVREATKWRITR